MSAPALADRRRLALRAAAPPLLLAILAGVVALLVYQHNTGWMYDLQVYRRGGFAALHGLDVYRDFPPPAFTYTPFAALLFEPLSFLPVNAAGLLWVTGSVLCLEASVWLCLGPLAGRPRPGFALCAGVCALAVWLDPISLTLLLGQVNIVLMLLVLLDLSLPDESRWKGLGIGVAAGIKLLPGFFIAYLLLTRRLRAAATAAATFAATVLVGFVALPAGSRRYWGGVFLDSSRVGDPQNVRSQSLRSLLVRWAHTGHGIQPAWIALAAATALVALLLAVRAHRRGDELLAICVCGIATLLVSPITWQHHWVWMVPVLIWLAERARRTGSRTLWIVTGAIAVEFYARPYQWGIPVDRVADLHLGPLQLLQSSTYAVTAVLVLALAAAALRRPTTRPRRRSGRAAAPAPT